MSNQRGEMGAAVGGILVDVANLLRGVWRMSRPQPISRRAAEAAARRAEKEARERRRAWLALVQRQMAHGSARDATEAEARAALAGRGGRRNPLDDRKF